MVHRLVGAGRAGEAIDVIESALAEATGSGRYTFLLTGLAVALEASGRIEDALSVKHERLARCEQALHQAGEWIGIAGYLDRAGAAAQEIASAYRMAAYVAPAQSWAFHEANISLGSIALKIGNDAEAARLLAEAMRAKVRASISKPQASRSTRASRNNPTCSCHPLFRLGMPWRCVWPLGSSI